ncbi:MAG: M28 family peptidase [Candidatus Zixiibacteriota bacterium]
MRRILLVLAVAGSIAAATPVSAADTAVVISDKQVRPADAAGLEYLGSCSAGYLYRGPEAALTRVAPYRRLGAGAAGREYYLIETYPGEGPGEAAFASLGTAVRLSDNEILVALDADRPFGELRALSPAFEVVRLAPLPAPRPPVDAETPPSRKNDRLAAGLEAVTADSYRGYVQALQNFKTRYTDTPGYDDARWYVHNYFGLQNLTPSFFAFDFGTPRRAHYPGPPECIMLDSSYGTIKRSSDGGRTWETRAPTGVDDIACSFWLDGDNAYVGGYNNVFAHSHDGGRTWTEGTIGPAGNVEYRPNLVAFGSEDVGWMAGQTFENEVETGNFFFKTENGGRTWSEQAAPAGFTPQWLDAPDEGHVWAGGAGGVLYSDDGGTSWRECNTGFTVWDFSAAGAASAWATDTAGRVYKTSNGVSWARVNPGIAGEFYYVSFPDAGVGFVLGDHLISTVDGGSSWRDLGPPPAWPCNVFAFADEDNGLVGYSFDGEVYLTTDGGQTFAEISGDAGFSAENVIGERRGVEAPDEVVLIGGHFDSISELPLCDAPGAEDNASGAACALAAAAAFRNLSFKRTVRCVVFGGEEEGLFGSTAYAAECAARGETVVAFLNADMVAFDEEYGLRDDYGIAYGDYEWLYDYFQAVASLYGNDLYYSQYEYRASDHKPFWDLGYPALAAIHGRAEFSGSPGYIWYHSTEDTIDKITPELACRFARDYAATVAHLAGIAGEYPDPPGPGTATEPFSRAFAVYPNPYRYSAAAGGAVTFVGLETPAKVEVYDLAGRRAAGWDVPAGTDEFSWRPEDTIASGVYIYRVEGQGQTETGKIAIIR